jgi:phosphotransferase system enzyme I (PtsP)
MDLQQAYAEKARLRARRQEQYRALRDKPPVSKDGIAIDLQMNAGLLVDLPNLDETGAAGVGLFRTEILFMVAPSLPRAQAQEGLYRTIIDIAGRRPVTFRTLDIGGDKVLPYLRKIDEENPALGWRAVRIGLDRPALLRTQFRALLGAARERDLRIMLPMVATLEEFETAQAMLARERERIRRLGQSGPRQVQLGVMLEVPSLLFDLDRIFERADFVSIGTNDLMQFMFAVDRENPRVAARFDALHPSFLRALAKVPAIAKARGKPVSICGEMAGRPIEALALLGLGYRSFSMSPSNIGPVKALVRAVDLGKLEALMRARLDNPTDPAIMRAELTEFAAAHDLSF